MTLPLLLSVPHAGLQVPPELASYCVLTAEEIAADGDEGAAEIYDLASEVETLVTTAVARAIVDVNRAPDDRRKDGVVKTHTCWSVPIWRESPPEGMIERLLQSHYHPYHHELRRRAAGAVLGIDCHTMAADGPPVGPDPGDARPAISLCYAEGTCPEDWLHSMAGCLERAFETSVALNSPFTGGYIIRSHAGELPWIGLEISRAPFLATSEKRARVLAAFREWCGGMRA